ncbi:unnamed protein product, partial [Polarella glacialis]
MAASYSFRLFAVTTAMVRRLDHEALLRLGSWREKVCSGNDRAPERMPARYAGEEKLVDQAIEKHSQLQAMQLAFRITDVTWEAMRLQLLQPLSAENWEECIKMSSALSVWVVPTEWMRNNQKTGFKLKQVARDRLPVSRPAEPAMSSTGAVISGSVRLVPK